MALPFFKAVLLQFSGILGAGIFALPYLFSRTSFPFAILMVVIVVLLISLINIFYCQIILKTKGDHQLPGYCQIYLGKSYQKLALLNIFLLAFGALLAYTKLASSAFQNLTGLSPLLSSSLVITLISILFLSRLPFFKLLSRTLPLIVLFLSFLLLIYALEYHPFVLAHNPVNLNFFGALMFALTGFTIIPEVEEIIRSSQGRRSLLPLASISGLLLAAAANLVFSYSLIILAGPHLSPDIVTGLSRISPALSSLISFVILLVTINASQNFLYVLKETFYRDLAFSKNTSYFLSLLFPFAGFLFSKISFIALISLTGGVTILVSALLICAIRLKISRHPLTTFLAFSVLSLMFLGLLSEFF